MIKDRERLENLRKKKREEKQREQEIIATQGDIRDRFKFKKVPFLAPADFKPLQVHEDLCKVCYDNKINTLFMPCRHELVCHNCAKFFNVAPHEGFKLIDVCPLCGEKYHDIVRIYRLKKAALRN